MDELQTNYRKIQEDYAALVKYKAMFKKEKEQKDELKRVQKELTDVARAREVKLEQLTIKVNQASELATLNATAASERDVARARAAVAERELRRCLTLSADANVAVVTRESAALQRATRAEVLARRVAADAMELARALAARDVSLRMTSQVRLVGGGCRVQLS